MWTCMCVCVFLFFYRMLSFPIRVLHLSVLARKQVPLLLGALSYLVFLQVPFGEFPSQYEASTLEASEKIMEVNCRYMPLNI